MLNTHLALLNSTLDLDDHLAYVGARVKVVESLAGVVEGKDLVNGGAEMDVFLAKEVAQILVILLCSGCDTPFAYISMFLTLRTCRKRDLRGGGGRVIRAQGEDKKERRGREESAKDISKLTVDEHFS